MKWLTSWWRNYRYRFTLWQALNNVRPRAVPESSQFGIEEGVDGDKPRKARHQNLEMELLQVLKPMMSPIDNLRTPEERMRLYRSVKSLSKTYAKMGEFNKDCLAKGSGFRLAVRPSSMGEDAGNGVFVESGGEVSAGQIVALYPGVVYQPYHPVLLQSISNPYIFRCSDGTLIDGKFQGISGSIFNSIHGRDRINGIDPMCDKSWLLLPRFPESLVNPLNLGQIVNNSNPKAGFEANVAYQELTLWIEETPSRILGLIPNANYEHMSSIRCVALVATKNIRAGEEVLATYFTLVEK